MGAAVPVHLFLAVGDGTVLSDGRKTARSAALNYDKNRIKITALYNYFGRKV